MQPRASPARELAADFAVFAALSATFFALSATFLMGLRRLKPRFLDLEEQGLLSVLMFLSFFSFLIFSLKSSRCSVYPRLFLGSSISSWLL